MPDESALRTDTDERNDETGTPAAAPSAASRRPTENSLLADLLSETSNEAQRELDQIKAELQSRKNAELEARRSADRQRRAELDRLREAELKRREAALRSPDDVDGPTTQSGSGPQQSTAAYESVLAATPKKSSGPIYAVAAVLIAAIATVGWYFTTKEKAQAEVQAAEKKAETITTAATAEKNESDEKDGNAPSPEGKQTTPAATNTPNTTAADAAKAEAEKAVDVVPTKRLAANESEAFERRVPEFDVPQYIKPKRKYRRGRKRKGPGKGKIKIRGLNLGAGR